MARLLADSYAGKASYCDAENAAARGPAALPATHRGGVGIRRVGDHVCAALARGLGVCAQVVVAALRQRTASKACMKQSIMHSAATAQRKSFCRGWRALGG